ncbi:MAG: class I SAM-dependent methyltransferase [Pseudomonadota bacterium]
MANFKDHFSDTPARYAEFRPTYPAELFAWLAGLCEAHEAAWDCATGSGQAAAGLAPHFTSIIATDASAEQVAHASGPGNVVFRVATAEASGLADNSIDLVTVAQAAHWFDLPRFFAEAQRVLKPAGVLALWGYGRLDLPAGMDEIFQRFYGETIGPWWPPERKWIDDGYRSLDFPFAEIAAPDFFIEVEWNLPRLLDYLSTWSAVKRYRSDKGVDPLPTLMTELQPLWGKSETALQLKWPLFLRVGRLSD